MVNFRRTGPGGAGACWWVDGCHQRLAWHRGIPAGVRRQPTGRWNDHSCAVDDHAGAVFVFVPYVGRDGRPARARPGWTRLSATATHAGCAMATVLVMVFVRPLRDCFAAFAVPTIDVRRSWTSISITSNRQRLLLTMTLHYITLHYN